MIRLFAPPTPDAVIRRNAMTAGSFFLHVVVVGLLFIPVSRAVKQGLFQQLAVYLIPPDNPAGQGHTLGNTPTTSVAAEAKPDPGGRAPTTNAPTGESGALRSVPLLSLTKPEPAPLVRPEDHAYTELQVDSAAARDPSSAAPEYPRWMLQKGIEGSASVLYVVDSTGLVDTTSYRVASTTHPDFALAVRLALPAMRFRPAYQEGHPVRQLVQQTFRFRINRTDSLRAPNDLPPSA
jgi:TonB family protein